MKHYLAATAAVLTAAVGTPALAQDAQVDSRAYNGVYVGASGGYDVQSDDSRATIGFDRNGDGNFSDAVPTAAGADAFSPGYCGGKARGPQLLPGGCENDRNRGSYYGRAGVDRQFGNIVIGLVGEFGRTDIVDYTSAFSTTPASYVFSRRVDWEATGGLRAGYAADQTLFYGFGKVGYARFKNRFFTTNTANSFSTLVDDRDRKGFVVGGGLEQRIMRRFSIGLEYSAHVYNGQADDYKVLVQRGAAAATNPFVLAPFTAGTSLRRNDTNFRWHSLRAVVGVRF
ncbi:outer membrane protein [Sphingomonas sp.]|uniref:outer membrane protein n=1 Tax=Sphingomonas sp. TaxID=28214 RepID=UPI003CC53BF9